MFYGIYSALWYCFSCYVAFVLGCAWSNIGREDE
jgi:hypothetical protein